MPRARCRTEGCRKAVWHKGTDGMCKPCFMAEKARAIREKKPYEGPERRMVPVTPTSKAEANSVSLPLEPWLR
jgi:hypothetical protein